MLAETQNGHRVSTLIYFRTPHIVTLSNDAFVSLVINCRSKLS